MSPSTRPNPQSRPSAYIHHGLPPPRAPATPIHLSCSLPSLTLQGPPYPTSSTSTSTIIPSSSFRLLFNPVPVHPSSLPNNQSTRNPTNNNKEETNQPTDRPQPQASPAKRFTAYPSLVSQCRIAVCFVLFWFTYSPSTHTLHYKRKYKPRP